jgi:hypothetical protein
MEVTEHAIFRFEMIILAIYSSYMTIRNYNVYFVEFRVIHQEKKKSVAVFMTCYDFVKLYFFSLNNIYGYNQNFFSG